MASRARQHLRLVSINLHQGLGDDAYVDIGDSLFGEVAVHVGRGELRSIIKGFLSDSSEKFHAAIEQNNGHIKPLLLLV